MEPDVVTDPTGHCVGDTACGVVRDGSACLDVCVATRWTPAAIPPVDDSIDIAAALDRRFAEVHMRGDRVGCSAAAGAAAAAAADAVGPDGSCSPRHVMPFKYRETMLHNVEDDDDVASIICQALTFNSKTKDVRCGG